MSQISASLVKELREKTNVGMMDCKAALVEAGGDLEAAEDILRKKGIAKAGKKADREAKEGLITVVIREDGGVGVLLEVNCETDFVAKNDNFRAFTDELAGILLATEVEDAAGFLSSAHPSGGTVEDVVKEKIAEIGENILIRRLARFETGANGRLASYIHMQGRVGVLLELEAGKGSDSFNADGVAEVVKDITLHIAAANPSCVRREELDPALVAKEREIAAEQVKGKPENVIEKIVDGKMGKFYAQVCLLEQGFIKDTDKTVGQLLEETGAKVGDSFTVTRFKRLGIGQAS